MINWILELDQELFLLLNSLHSPIMDSIMLFLTHRLTFIPLYAAIIIWLIYHFKWKKGAILIVTIILTVIFTDSFSSRVVKPGVKRYRPCADPEIEAMVHAYHCRSQYGFFSSHAANTFALAFFISCYTNRRWGIAFLAWSAIVSYTRIYLGVHYPIDIIVGALFGVGCAYFSNQMLKKYLLPKFTKS
jgi:undecaprenyl-diphosphatase